MSYVYNSDDLKEIMYLNKFDFSLILFKGEGCCRNISMLTKELLTLKEIANDTIATEGFHKDKGHMFNHIKEKQKNDHFYFNRNGRFFVSLHCYDLIAYASLRLARVSTISSEAIRPRNLAQSSLLTKCTR